MWRALLILMKAFETRGRGAGGGGAIGGASRIDGILRHGRRSIGHHPRRKRHRQLHVNALLIR
jgi:hypothetical protein